MELFDVLILSEYEPAKKIKSGVTSQEFKVLIENGITLKMLVKCYA